jgi:hypothetical protein
VKGVGETVSNIASGDVGKAATDNPISKIIMTSPDSDRANNSRFRILTEKAAQPKEVLEALEDKMKGNPLNNADKALVERAERRTGMTARQIFEINQMQKELNGLVRKNAKEGRPTDYTKFSNDAMKRINNLGITGGFER